MACQRVALALALLLGIAAVVTAEWGYEGANDRPDEWSNEFPFCDGKKQSPIDIKCNQAKHRKTSSPVITVEREGNATLINNLHSAQWTPGDGLVTLTSPSLDGVYQLAQVHFHWGRTSKQGSEHSFDGKKASMEMHMVFFSPKFSSFNEAVKDNEPDNLAVVGVMFKETEIDNEMLDPVVDNLNYVRRPNATTFVPFMHFDAIDTSLVFEYSGSLTTPGCNEIVRWFVLPQLHSIGDNQISKFRHLTYEDGVKMGNNFRPTQDLNGRKVYRNFNKCHTRFVAEY